MKHAIIASIISVVVTFAVSSLIFHDNRPPPANVWETHELPMPDQIVWDAWLAEKAVADRETGKEKIYRRWEYQQVIRVDMPGNDPDAPVQDFYFLASGEGAKMPLPRPKALTTAFPEVAPW